MEVCEAGEVYTRNNETIRDARDDLARYLHFYNTARLHEALGYRIPQEVYFGEGRNDEGQARLTHT